MKEEQIDKFIGKRVEITDFENDTYIGVLYKIADYETYHNGMTCIHSINNGYYLDQTAIGGLDLRKSYIKKIREL